MRGLNLEKFAASDEGRFLSVLNDETELLRLKFPRGAQNWGAARKVLNLFLRDSLYNRYLSKHYELRSLEYWLEVPLDKDVAHGIKQHPLGVPLKSWTSIKCLQPQDSEAYQSIGHKIASENGLARVHLDLLFWRQKRK